MRRGVNQPSPLPVLDGNVENEVEAKPKRGTKPWLFFLCAWACYMRYLSNLPIPDEGNLGNPNSSPVDSSFIEVVETPDHESVQQGLNIEKIGISIELDQEDKEGSTTPQIDTSNSNSESKDGSSSSIVGDDTMDDGKGSELPMIGATLALSGKCSSPDYGTSIFYIKTKHTGSGKLAGILRRIGFLHNMVVVDPPKGGNSFKDESDFHRVAQGKCVDMLVAHTKRASWLDKAFKASLKFSSIRDPVLRAVSAYEHSVACGQHCSMCWKLLNDKIRWARQCSDVADAQYNLMKGAFIEPEDIIDDYDFVLVTERYFESLVVLRHILGVSLAEMLHLDEEMNENHVVSLSNQPQRFLDVIVARNENDRNLYQVANEALDDKIHIIGKSVVRKEVKELKVMLELLQHTCTDRVKARDIMGGSYIHSRDCLWHQQGCGNLCITRWSSLYESARTRQD